jgi:hypothetical protein
VEFTAIRNSGRFCARGDRASQPIAVILNLAGYTSCAMLVVHWFFHPAFRLRAVPLAGIPPSCTHTYLYQLAAIYSSLNIVVDLEFWVMRTVANLHKVPQRR